MLIFLLILNRNVLFRLFIISESVWCLIKIFIVKYSFGEVFVIKIII